MFNTTLPEFQEFLLSRNLVNKKNVSFYAYWASRFLSFSNSNENLNQALCIRKFLSYLKGQKNISDWQIRQADEALRLYFDHFKKGKESRFKSGPRTNSIQKKQITPDVSDIINRMREAIRIKHYSYKTERSYIDWAKRFYNYIINVKKKDIHDNGLNSMDVKDYLGYLAIRQRVSSSTQNQAFNALLFLFRDVLGIDLSDMGNTVRAKRGPRLPVVFTMGEVQKLFKLVGGKNLLILQFLYGSGLRLMELARLRAKRH